MDQVLDQALRTVHVICGIGWLGEVLVVLFVLTPALRRMDAAGRAAMLGSVYPRVFRLATALGVITIAAGFAMLWEIYDFNTDYLFGTTRGVALLAGASLGGGLYVFHLVAEHRLTGITSKVRDLEATPEESERLIRLLRVVPVIGGAILVAAVVLMVAASRYLY